MQKELRIGSSGKYNLDGGINYADDSAIELSQSPYEGLLNMTLDNGGTLIKRKGQSYLYATSLGSGGIKGIYPNFKGNTIIVHGSKVYTQQGNSNPTEIYSSYTGSKAYMFTFNGVLYFLSGSKYYQYDGTTFKEVEPYKPIISINRKPDGSQTTPNESWNMLGNGFRETFNGDGTSKTFILSLKELDGASVGTITAKVNGTVVTVSSQSLTEGKVVLETAPSVGVNNVEITAYKVFSQLKENILGCTFGTEFSNRMFISGNSNLCNYYFASGLSELNDVSYFPQKYQYAIKGNDKAVTGMKVQYNKLIVFKEDLTALVESSTGLDNLASFPISFLNTDIGCDIPNSIQLINNNIVFANTQKGVNMIVSTVIADEKAIIPLSLNVNGDSYRSGLIYEDTSLLKAATSVDYDSKYILNVGSKCYVWDYKFKYSINTQSSLKWFIWDNIKSNTFFTRDNQLMYGHRDIGQIVQFNSTLADFSNPINATVKTKLMDFGMPDYLKTVMYIYYTCRANTSSSIDITYFNDKGEKLISESVTSKEMTNFNWSKFAWNNLSWKVQIVPPTFRFKSKVKKIRYFQLEFTNNKVNENLSILDLVIQYTLTKKVK